MHQSKFIDGTPVPAEYLEQVSRMVSAACVAEEICAVDELEKHAASVGCVSVGHNKMFNAEEVAEFEYLDNLRANGFI